MAHCVWRRPREMVPAAQLVVFLRARAIAPDQTPRGIVEIETLTAALPIHQLIARVSLDGRAGHGLSRAENPLKPTDAGTKVLYDPRITRLRMDFVEEPADGCSVGSKNGSAMATRDDQIPSPTHPPRLRIAPGDVGLLIVALALIYMIQMPRPASRLASMFAF